MAGYQPAEHPKPWWTASAHVDDLEAWNRACEEVAAVCGEVLDSRRDARRGICPPPRRRTSWTDVSLPVPRLDYSDLKALVKKNTPN